MKPFFPPINLKPQSLGGLHRARRKDPAIFFEDPQRFLAALQIGAEQLVDAAPVGNRPVASPAVLRDIAVSEQGFVMLADERVQAMAHGAKRPGGAGLIKDKARRILDDAQSLAGAVDVGVENPPETNINAALTP